MNDNTKYKGRIDPGSAEWAASPWAQLVKDRYHLASLFCKGKTVLDSCCGTGWGTVYYISPKASETVGFDLVTPEYSGSEIPGKLSFARMDARNIVLERDHFDVVLALDSIEHFSREDGLIYLGEMDKVCKENGMIFGTTPLIKNKSLIPIYLGWNRTHVYLYTREFLEAALKERFKHFFIWEIYNKVCPYFVFIASNSPQGIPEYARGIMRGFIFERKEYFYRQEIAANLKWAKNLAFKLNIPRSLFFLCRAISIKFRGPR